MGKTVIGEELFPEIVKLYNSGGRRAAYDYLRSIHGIRNPYYVINRIRKCGKYTYYPDTDQFMELDKSTADSIFMDLDELCGNSIVSTDSPVSSTADTRSVTMEELIHELISDRLMMLSRYITLDSSTRTILIDQTSLIADGYQVVTH